MNFGRIFHNLNYAVSALLFLIGLYTVAVKPNLIKKLIGLNIMETSVFLFIVSVGMVDEGVAPIVTGGYKAAEAVGRVVNPIPQALILTGIVVAVSTTAVALSLCLKIYERYGILNATEILGREEP